MKRIYIVTIIITLLFAACGGNSDNKTKKPKSVENGEVFDGDEQGNGTHYIYKNWKIVREVDMKEHDAHGAWKEYYDDGKLRYEVNYNRAKKEGLATEYYDTGEKYIETPYKDNKIDGTKYRYKKDGAIVFEAPYVKGDPIPGIKEYAKDGKLIEQPTIVFTRKGGNLEMKLSDNKSAEFFQMVEGEKLKVPVENGVGKLILGNAKKGQINIRAIYKTGYGNKAAIDANY